MAYKFDVSRDGETVSRRQIMDVGLLDDSAEFTDWGAFIKGWYNGTGEDGAVGVM